MSSPPAALAPHLERCVHGEPSSVGPPITVSISALGVVAPLTRICPRQFTVYPCPETKPPGTLKVPVWIVVGLEVSGSALQLAGIRRVVLAGDARRRWHR